MIHASYSAILFVQSKHNLAVKGVYPSLGDIRTAPISCPVAFEAPSNASFHRAPGSGPSSSP
ncbi:hypothetical protein A2U01_0108824, partial [Trifolium medium]|nr:hypothetical protein [Trifolium medium]